MQIGFIRVDSFKFMAKTIRKRIQGCNHSYALEQLSRACGMENYHHLLKATGSGIAKSSLLSGDRSELIDYWEQRISAEFSIECRTVLSSEEIETWFDRVFVPREQLATNENGLLSIVEQIVDPKLQSNQWNDAEFHQRLLREISREAKHPLRTN